MNIKFIIGILFILIILVILSFKRKSMFEVPTCKIETSKQDLTRQIYNTPTQNVSKCFTKHNCKAIPTTSSNSNNKDNECYEHTTDNKIIINNIGFFKCCIKNKIYYLEDFYMSRWKFGKSIKDGELTQLFYIPDDNEANSNVCDGTTHKPFNEDVISLLNNRKNLSGIFWGATSFNRDISSIIVSEVTDMSHTFKCASIFNNGGSEDINKWITTNVTTMEGMFEDAKKFNQPVNKWDVSKVENFTNMFKNAITFNKLIFTTSSQSTIHMKGMFEGAKTFNQPVNDWDVSSVINFINMFKDAEKFNQRLDKWKFNRELYDDDDDNNRNLYDEFNNMFQGAKSFRYHLFNLLDSKYNNNDTSNIPSSTSTLTTTQSNGTSNDDMYNIKILENIKILFDNDDNIIYDNIITNYLLNMGEEDIIHTKLIALNVGSLNNQVDRYTSYDKITIDINPNSMPSSKIILNKEGDKQFSVSYTDNEHGTDIQKIITINSNYDTNNFIIYKYKLIKTDNNRCYLCHYINNIFIDLINVHYNSTYSDEEYISNVKIEITNNTNGSILFSNIIDNNIISSQNKSECIDDYFQIKDMYKINLNDYNETWKHNISDDGEEPKIVDCLYYKSNTEECGYYDTLGIPGACDKCCICETTNNCKILKEQNTNIERFQNYDSNSEKHLYTKINCLHYKEQIPCSTDYCKALDKKSCEADEKCEYDFSGNCKKITDYSLNYNDYKKSSCYQCSRSSNSSSNVTMPCDKEKECQIMNDNFKSGGTMPVEMSNWHDKKYNNCSYYQDKSEECGLHDILDNDYGAFDVCNSCKNLNGNNPERTTEINKNNDIKYAKWEGQFNDNDIPTNMIYPTSSPYNNIETDANIKQNTHNCAWYVGNKHKCGVYNDDNDINSCEACDICKNSEYCVKETDINRQTKSCIITPESLTGPTLNITDAYYADRNSSQCDTEYCTLFTDCVQPNTTSVQPNTQ